ncbi:sigma-70 family RNA polymerase sigma factor [Bacillus sp. ISL-47]|uniref:sigma-70 family RNA polymerase sigma factor n=1 Tax=Bacillus sp. ISL-47 TaxID=2819130 RepID=UPI001BEACD39|nr:sigma-70 family RNA polymerase sigma factor [Bacillus sp. ISL-47]MBT2687384.1 sigma-70 family RNA polymerase sigma factor [Bacillus sp. ISL-47]MBT2707154.1 sigma-70 family RNA polymerase sigma factor [Pseudomonas sp. ISL-84]
MESFEQVAAQYEPMIHQIIKTLNIYKNQDEFFQLGLIRLWEIWKKHDPAKGKFLSYAYTNIRMKMLDELKRSKVLEGRSVVPDEEFWTLMECPLTDQPLKEKMILSYCEGLTTNQTIWVTSTFLYNLSTNEIAEQHQVTVSAVKAWKKGALTRLRTILQPEQLH